MAKQEKIEKLQSISWQDTEATEPTAQITLASQIMNIMEQGIIVWSAQGYCELHNTRIFDVLELRRDGLSIGTPRDDFMQRALDRGEFTKEVLEENKRLFAARTAFQFDRHLPSGRVVQTSARPMREGGYVVTSTDVTEARKAAAELTMAKQAAEEAEAQARKILEEERSRRAEAKTLSNLDEWLQSSKSLGELYDIVTKFMERLIPNSAGELYLYSNSRDVLDGACEWGQDSLIHAHIDPDSCWSLRRGRSYDHDPTDISFPCDHLSADHRTNRSNYICIPVIAHGDTVGLLHIYYDPSVSRSDVERLNGFASRAAEHISMAVANVKLRDELHDQSIRDPLTSLYNRRYFMDAMRREVAKVDRQGGSLGLISFDADKFKMFNDNHGHESGDMVLRAIAECMHACLPNSAVHARVGGEEFAILMPDATLEQTCDAAELFREAVAQTEVRTAFGLLPKVTISAGVTDYTGTGQSPSALLKQADEALYDAKNNGRNRIEAARAG